MHFTLAQARSTMPRIRLVTRTFCTITITTWCKLKCVLILWDQHVHVILGITKHKQCNLQVTTAISANEYYNYSILTHSCSILQCYEKRRLFCKKPIHMELKYSNQLSSCVICRRELSAYRGKIWQQQQYWSVRLQMLYIVTAVVSFLHNMSFSHIYVEHSISCSA